MSHAYKFSGHITANGMEQANRIIQAINEFDCEFDLEEFTFDTFSGDATIHIPDTVLYATGGSGDSAIVGELQKTIWEAAGEYVKIYLRSIDLEVLPYIDYCSSTHEYEDFVEDFVSGQKSIKA